MKIAIINPWSVSNKSIGGTERFVIDLAESLKEIGNEVDVYMFSGESHFENGVKYINIDLFNMIGEADEYVIQNAFGEFETEKSYDDLTKILEEKIDVSTYDAIQLNSQLFLQAWKWKKRIFTIHTNPFEYELAWGEKSYNKMLETMSRYKNDDNTIFVAPSKFYANEYNKLTNCNIVFIPHAIDVKRIQTQKSREEIIKQYNLDDKKNTIIVPSRLEPIQKQPILLLEACCLLTEEEKSKIQIIYTGLDKQYIKFVDELKEKAKNNNLNINIIRFDEMSEVYKIADLTVLPSKSESFGYSALESLSLGIPTILNSIPTFKEISIENNNCELFENSASELKNKITQILLDKKRNQIIIPSKEWCERYKPDIFAKNYLNLI